jgi:anti-sigma factor RsiW
MTRCELPFETLSAYADGQLQPDQELEVRRHLDECTPCRHVIDTLLQMNEAVASASEVHPVPHGLRERVNQLASSKPLRSKRSVWAALALAAALLVAVGLGLWARWSEGAAADQLAQALIEDHLRYLKIPDAIQVASSDPRRIADSFNNRVGFPIELPQLSGASLLGARFCWLRGHKAVLSFYESNGRRFSVFVLDKDALPEQGMPKDQCKTSGKYEACMLRSTPELIAMVGDKQQMQAVLPQLEHFGAAQRPR